MMSKLEKAGFSRPPATANSQRYKLTIEYDGRPYVGWQRQDNGASIQQILEEALAAFDQRPETDESFEKTLPSISEIAGAGRTDAGVHALAMVAHADIRRPLSALRIMGAFNHYLKGYPVSVLKVEPVSKDFHARFSAKKRHYIYKILNRRAPPSFEEGLVWHVIAPLDAARMHEAAQILVGRHDFTTFRASECQSKSPVKTLDYIRVSRTEAERIEIEIGARSFLHHQVRSITGCLRLVGEGKWSKQDLKTALERCDRAALGLNAPSDGLYFRSVDY